MRISTFLLVLVAVGLVGTTPEASAKATEDFERVVAFSPGGSFQISNKNGSITVKTWNEGSVRIEATKTAKRESYLDDIEIVVEGEGGAVSVETVHNRKRDGGKVSYVISIPAEANVDVRTANGSVTIDGIQGRVEARSTNGSLKVNDVAGEIVATTTNGSIRAAYRMATDGTHEFRTTNGSVRVYLPSDAGGDFEAKTVNGSISVDFPTTVTRVSRRHMKGSFGGGGGSFDIKTVNGSVKILPN